MKKTHICVKVILVLLMVSFFLPFFTVSCDKERIPLSGKNLTFGSDALITNKEDPEQDDKGLLLFGLLFLLPLLVIISGFIPYTKKYFPLIASIGSAICFVLLLFAIYRLNYVIRTDYKSLIDMISYRVKYGYYLSVGGHLGVITLLFLDERKKNCRNETRKDY